MKAPDFDGGIGWLNTDHPLHIKDLKGKVVLLDFWTFCCINCMHIIPDLKKLEAKYPHELVVVGVHSAKFDNEKDSNNIREAILRYGIEHPVVNDANFKIWKAYTVNSWPTLVLIDPEGRIIGTVPGEGNYDAIDTSIQKLIEEFEKKGKIDRKPIHFALEKNKLAATPLSFPGKIAADDKSKRLFIADSDHNRIVVTDPDGKVLHVIGSGKQGLQDANFASASFHHPQGLFVSGNKVYVADTENHAIRQIDLETKEVTTIAGNGRQSEFGGGGGSAQGVSLNSPWDLLLLNNKLYIAMAGPHQLWVMDMATGIIHPYAGNGRENIVDGPLKDASLAQPSGITTNGDKLFFVDSEVSAVRSAELKPDGHVNTIIGEGLFEFGDKDGIGQEARLQHPLGIAWHGGKLFVADSYNHKIKIIDPITKSASTFLGNAKAGMRDGYAPQFSEPAGLAFLGDKLYIADTNNNAIRVVDLVEKKVSTLTLDGLKPPAFAPSAASQSKSESVEDEFPMPNRVISSSEPQQIKPGDGKIIFNVTLPKGYHLNKETTVSYRVFPRQGTSIKLKGPERGIFKPPVLPIEVPFTATSGESMIRFTTVIYYCNDAPNSVCLVKTIDAFAPVKVSPSATTSDLRIDSILPTPTSTPDS